jgi:hypothetical protein
VGLELSRVFTNNGEEVMSAVCAVTYQGPLTFVKTYMTSENDRM